MSNKSDSPDSSQLQKCRSISLTTACLLTALSIFALFAGSYYPMKVWREHQMAKMKAAQMNELKLLGDRFLDKVQLTTLSGDIHYDQRLFGFSFWTSHGKWDPWQKPHTYFSGWRAIMLYEVPVLDGEFGPSYRLSVEFNFENKNNKWVMTDDPLIDPERLSNASAKAFERTLLAEDQDVKALIASLEAHKQTAFEAAMKKFPMTPPSEVK